MCYICGNAALIVIIVTEIIRWNGVQESSGFEGVLDAGMMIDTVLLMSFC